MRAALESARPLRRVVISRESSGGPIEEIINLSRAAAIPFEFRPRSYLDRLVGRQHQGVVAMVAIRAYADFDQLLANLDRESFLVFLDRVQDPQNLGAIIRSACVVGADAVVIPQRHSAGLTGSVAKASAGAIDHIPICCVNNLKQAIELTKETGFWITALSPKASRPFTEIDYLGRTAIVIGGEERGIRPTILAACDNSVYIPMASRQIGSFNASVAAGIALFEVQRRRLDTSQ